MDGNDDWFGFLMRMALVVAHLCSCDGMSGGSDWVAVSNIEGALAGEVVSDRQGSAGQEPLCIGSFNVEFGERTAQIAEVLTSDPTLLAVDVWLFQEIEAYPDEGTSRAQKIADALEMNHAYVPERTEGDGTHGLAILSRFPLADVERMRLPSQQTLVRSRNKIAIRADVLVGQTPVQVSDVHLDLRLNLSDRISQIHPVVESADRTAVIGGDLNTNPYVWADSLPILPADTATDADHARLFDEYMMAYDFSAPVADLGATQASLAGEFRLDGLFARDLEIDRAGVAADSGVSDHRPIWICIDLPSE